LRGSYNITEKLAGSVALTYSLPMKQSESFNGTNLQGTYSVVSVGAQAIWHIIGAYDDDFSLYLPFGAAYIIGKAKYKGSIAGITPDDAPLSGPTFNLGLGAQYRIGTPYIFAEAGAAFPANQTTNSRTGTSSSVENNAPGHTIISLGIRIPLDSGY
jgi:hypothetical protein